VERSAAGGDDWRPLTEGAELRTGDRLRTGPDATAHLAFPAGRVTLGPASSARIVPAVSPFVSLEAGRIEQTRGAGDLVKLATAEAVVRGRGHVVVRRRDGSTTVSVLDGRVRVEAGPRVTSLSGGQGLRLRAGRTGPPEAAAPLPPPPRLLVPGADPRYLGRDEPLPLSWDSPGAAFHVQVLAVGSDEVLLAREVAAPPLVLRLPWLGTFRWRVSARDPLGQEGPPSADGHVCVVVK
jgi:hypothetical protein